MRWRASTRNARSRLRRILKLAATSRCSARATRCSTARSCICSFVCATISMSASCRASRASAARGASPRAPMTWGDDALVVLPATLPLDELKRRLALADAAVIMKIGRNFARAKEALVATGMAERAIYVERATMAGEVVTPLCSEAGRFRALFLDHSRAGEGAPAVSGRVMIVGLGPGPAEWMTPEASAAIEAASDVVGYGPYVDRLALRPDQRAHASDNRVEMDRARLALKLAAEGREVAVVSGGDPGVFAMAAAVFEADRRESAMAQARHSGRAGRDGDAGGRGAARRAARPRLLRHLALRQSEALGRSSSAACARPPRAISSSRFTIRLRRRGRPASRKRSTCCEPRKRRRRRSPSLARSGAPTRR